MNNIVINDLKIFAKHLNLLIVEDENDLANELLDFFKLFFKDVKVANDGIEALNLYKEHRFDIVITDINMPKMNGVELSRQLRILNKDQVIIVLSGYIDSFVVDLIDIGIQALIIKPYVIMNFLQKILQQCENIVLKKAFEEMKLSKRLKKDSKKELPDSKLLVLNSIADKIVNSKSVDEYISEYKNTLDVNQEIDDKMWLHISADIQELNCEYQDLINLTTLHGIKDSSLYELIRIFSNYHSNLIQLPGLEEVSLIFLDLSNFILESSLDYNNIANETFVMFEFFYEDIINFFNVIFINKESKNINHLTQSLRSSVEQIKNNLILLQ